MAALLADAGQGCEDLVAGPGGGGGEAGAVDQAGGAAGARAGGLQECGRRLLSGDRIPGVYKNPKNKYLDNIGF